LVERYYEVVERYYEVVERYCEVVERYYEVVERDFEVVERDFEVLMDLHWVYLQEKVCLYDLAPLIRRNLKKQVKL